MRSSYWAPFVRGDDGLTWWQRRVSARRWARGPARRDRRQSWEDVMGEMRVFFSNDQASRHPSPRSD